jgi:alpha-ketoglutarate-dependent taurine dioxygenase
MSMTIKDRPLLLASEGRRLEDLDEASIWEGLDAHGAILFRGFDVDADGFYDFASRFNRSFLVSPFSDRKAASDSNELQTVTLGRAGLNLHFEYGSSPMRPDLLWFYCRRPAAEGAGGETLLADGVSIFDRLKPETQAALRSRRVKYKNFVPTESFEAMIRQNKAVKSLVEGDVVRALGTRRSFQVTEETPERVVFEFIAPPVAPVGEDGRMRVSQDIFADAYKSASDVDAQDTFSVAVTWEDGAEIEQDVLHDLKAATRSLTRGIRWRAGDFAMIDNNRLLHGRNQTTDPGRDIVMLSSFSTRFDI